MTCIIAASAAAEDAGLPENARVVVAIRYFQINGISHSHLWLYSADGKPLRQLTNFTDRQDRDPIFSPDGKTIAFRREERGKSIAWSVLTEGGKAQPLQEVPSWYFEALKNCAQPFDFPWESGPTNAKNIRIIGSTTPGEVRYVAPDHTTEVVLKGHEDPDNVEGRFPKEPWLREKDHPDVRISELPFTAFDASGTKEEEAMRNAPGPSGEREASGESEASENKPSGALEGVIVYQGSPFVWIPPLRVALLTKHMGSSNGDASFAVNLNTHTLHELCTSSSAIYEVATVPGFFCFTSERYLPLGDGKRTVNCSFLDVWNAQLHRTRFCAPKVAQFYGGSLLLPGTQETEVRFFPGELDRP